MVSPHGWAFRFNLITVDSDDNKFVDCAIQANARYIMTNRHEKGLGAEVTACQIRPRGATYEE